MSPSSPPMNEPIAADRPNTATRRLACQSEKPCSSRWWWIDRQATGTAKAWKLSMESHQELQPQGEVSKGKPRHGTSNPLKYDNLEAPDTEYCFRFHPHAVRDGAPCARGGVASWINRPQEHHRACDDADHRSGEVGKPPALDPVGCPACGHQRQGRRGTAASLSGSAGSHPAQFKELPCKLWRNLRPCKSML